MQDHTAPIATQARQVKLAGRLIHVQDDKPTFWARVDESAWEPETLATIASHVGPGVTFLDLGAWVGPTTLLAASLGANCIAVEADPEALRQLRSNLAVNPELAARVRVLDRAVSASSAPVTMAARRKPGDSMSSALLAGASPDERLRWQSPAITPEELARLIPADAPLFIKLDIEGGEFALLPHLKPLLERPAPTQALVSFHPGILRETGASEVDITARTDGALAPFAGWRARAINPPAQVPDNTTTLHMDRHELANALAKKQASQGAEPDAGAIAAGRQADCWLFQAA